MDPVLIEFAKYGLAALLAALVIFAQYRAIVFLFKKYDEAQIARIELGEKILEVTGTQTAAIEALSDVIKAERRGGRRE